MRSLTGEIVVITGAGGGLGREMVCQLLQAGAWLILSDYDRALMLRAAEDAAHRVPRAKGRVLGMVTADLAQYAGCQALYEQAMRISPRVDMLINNAGIAIYGRIDYVPPDEIDRLLQIDLHTPMHLTQHFLPQMIARRHGHIVNISSVAGLVGSTGLDVYSAAKFGLRGFSEALAAGLRDTGVGVTALYPFYTRTPILTNQAQYGVSERKVMPEQLIDEPDAVVTALLKGITAGREHVYPSFNARGIELLHRAAPWLVKAVERRITTA